ncbi:MAG: RNA 2',3'-cyclic phosphodiesterase [Chloroflexota bacterium]|nr:RNA 2',3'-cyclic phosphodiesterase [Chloroflexota bacterium]
MNRTRRTSSREPAQPAQRLFAAVQVSDAVREQMRAIRSELEPQGWTVRWVDPDLAHLTVKFFGDTRPNQIASLESKLDFAAKRSQPAQLTTGSFIMFGPRKRPNVLSLAIEPADDDPAALTSLETLAKNVERQTASIGAGGNERAFKAHLTLGRFKDSDGAPADIEQVLSTVDVQPVEFTVDRLVLVRSILSQQGPTYTTIAEWPLTATATAENEQADTPAPDDHG